MKLLALERKYLLEMLDQESRRLNSPMSKTMSDWYAMAQRTSGELAYRDRLEKARANKAKLVAGIICKLNNTP